MTTSAQATIYGLALLAGFFTLGLICLTQAPTIQRLAVRRNRRFENVPLIGQIAYHSIRGNFYVLFLRLIGSVFILVSAYAALLLVR